MKLEKMNFASMQKLSRGEMKKIMAGSGDDDGIGGSPKIEACVGKNANDACSWEYQNRLITGKCTSYMAQAMHCSDLL